MRAPRFEYRRAILAASLFLSMVALSACATAPSPFDPLPMGRSVSAPTGFLQFCQRRPDQCQVSEPLADHRLASEPARLDFAGGLQPTSLVFQRSVSNTADLFAKPFRPDDNALLQARPIPLNDRTTAPPAALLFDGQTPLRIYAPITRDASGVRLHLSTDLQGEIAKVDVGINRAITPRTDLEAFGVDNYWALPLTDGPRAEGNCKHYALEKRRQLVADGVPADALSLAIVTTPANEVHAVLVIATDQGDLVLDNLTDAIRPWRQTGYHWLVRQTPAAPLRWVEAG